MVKIAIWNPIVFGDVKRLLECKFGGVREFDNTVIVVGYNVATISPAEFRQQNAGKRIIVFNLEQFYDGSRWFNERAIAWFRIADELWDYDLSNIRFLNVHGFQNVKYHPMEYCESLRMAMRAVDARDIDVLFYGTPSDRRLAIMQKYMGPSQYKYSCFYCTGLTGELQTELLSRTKILVNIHADARMTRQEQVRMFIPVISGMCVVSEPSVYNEFGKSIIECAVNDLPATIAQLLRTGDWRTIGASAPNRYAEHCLNRKV